MGRLFSHLTRLTTSSRFRQNIVITLMRQVLTALVQLLLVVLIARELGPEGNGLYAMTILLPTMLANFLNLGVGPATVYYVSRKELNVNQAFAGNLRLATAVSAVGLSCALPVFLIWGDYIFPGVPKNLIYLGLASFPLTLFLAYLNTILQGLEQFKAFNLTVLLPPLINLGCVVVAVYVLSFGIAAAMVSYMVGQLVGLILVFWILTQRKFKEAPADSTQTTAFAAHARRTLSYGWKAHLSNILAFVNYRADIFLVNLLLNPSATGVYVIAVQIAEKLWMLSQAASTVFLPRLSAMHRNPEARLALTSKGFLVVSGITAFASAFVAAGFYWLISPIFGDEYLEALPAFLWLLPGIISGAGSRIYANSIAAAGKPEWNMYSALIVVVVNIIGNVLLLPRFGIAGAACATSVAYCLNAILKFWLIKKL